MSWAEVFKINSNMKKPLNEQLRDLKFQPIKIITATGTYTPEKTGTYRVICVGAGGNGASTCTSAAYYTSSSGGGGGVSIKTLKLLSSSSYNVTVGTTASFSYGSNSITATAGGNASSGTGSATGGTGGTASGGDYNYPGNAGTGSKGHKIFNAPGSVGVYIGDLSRSTSAWLTVVDTCFELKYGDSILGYGGSGNGFAYYKTSTSGDYAAVLTTGLPAAVIIIPLELEE